MDFSQAFDAPITENIGGKDISFPIIPVPVLSLQIATKAKQAKKDKARQMIEEFKLFGQDRLLTLRDASAFFIEDINDYLGTLEGAVETLKVSLSVRNAPAEEVEYVVAHLKPWLANRIALLVTQFATIEEIPKEPDEPTAEEVKKENPLPAAEAATKGFGDS